MKTALHALIQAAPVCSPIKADLRQSTVTLEWPANSLIQRADYVLVPKAEVDAALANDSNQIVINKPTGDITVLPILSDRCFEVERGTFSCTIYFDRFTDPAHPKPPGTWWGALRMKDADGKTRSSSLPRMVMNDFGDLVDLTTGERP